MRTRFAKKRKNRVQKRSQFWDRFQVPKIGPLFGPPIRNILGGPESGPIFGTGKRSQFWDRFWIAFFGFCAAICGPLDARTARQSTVASHEESLFPIPHGGARHTASRDVASQFLDRQAVPKGGPLLHISAKQHGTHFPFKFCEIVVSRALLWSNRISTSRSSFFVLRAFFSRPPRPPKMRREENFMAAAFWHVILRPPLLFLGAPVCTPAGFEPGTLGFESSSLTIRPTSPSQYHIEVFI